MNIIMDYYIGDINCLPGVVPGMPDTLFVRPRRRPNRRRCRPRSSSSDFSKAEACRDSRSNKKPKQRKERRAKSDFMALDCEMVGVGYQGYKSSIARVTLINWYGEVLLDENIQQTEPVTDYRTFVSGITKEDLQEATMTLDECREWLLQTLDDKILIGHGLNNDLRALGITHPWWLTRDTAKYEPLMKDRFNNGILWPRKLKDIVNERLGEEIQVSGRPHDPYEDAFAVLSLYKLMRPQWENLMAYKRTLFNIPKISM